MLHRLVEPTIADGHVANQQTKLCEPYRFFYEWAVSCIPAWGELVVSAFACYLPALAAQCGFALPTTDAQRQAFWTTFSQQ